MNLSYGFKGLEYSWIIWTILWYFLSFFELDSHWSPSISGSSHFFCLLLKKVLCVWINGEYWWKIPLRASQTMTFHLPNGRTSAQTSPEHWLSPTPPDSWSQLCCQKCSSQLGSNNMGPVQSALAPSLLWRYRWKPAGERRHHDARKT